MISTKHFSAAILSTVIWGFFSLPLRALKNYPSDQILYYRVFTSFIIMLVICLLFRKESLKKDFHYYQSLPPIQQKKLIWQIIGVSLLITCNWFSFIYVVNHVSLKSAAFAYMICPIITALAAYFILKEHLTTRKFIAIGIALLSVAILSFGIITEMIFSVVVASLYAFYLIIQKKMEGLNKFNFLALQFFLSSILILPTFIIGFSGLPADVHFWYNIFIISIVFTIIPLFLSLYALEGIPSATMGITIYLNPIISFTIAFIYFKEQAGWQQIISYSTLFIAVVIFNTKKGMLFKGL